jgi:hypothetical protein
MWIKDAIEAAVFMAFLVVLVAYTTDTDGHIKTPIQVSVEVEK